MYPGLKEPEEVAIGDEVIDLDEANPMDTKILHFVKVCAPGYSYTCKSEVRRG